MSKITLVGISGFIGSGKTTISDYLCNNYGFTNYSFAEPLKKGVKEMFGFTDDQMYTQKGKETVDKFWGISPRRALQYIGTEVMRDSIDNLIPGIGEAFWIQSFIKTYDKTKKIVIDDVRFVNEINIIKKLGGVVYKVKRESSIVIEHKSESTLSKYELYDGTFDNNKNIDNLKKQIDKIFS